FVEQKMSRTANRFLSRAQTRLDGRAHVDPWSRIARRKKTLRSGSVPERLRQNEFRHVDSAKTFCRLENHYRRRRHCLDANPRGHPIRKKKRRIRAAASLRRCVTIRFSIPILKKARAFRSARSFSADAEAARCRSCFNRSIGNTAFISARPWLRRQPRRRPAR